MPTLSDYQQFNGRHWETGTIANFFAHRGFKAPHTGESYSEALLLGVSGGIVMGYFTFLYEGYDPQCNILTRNTFDPWDTLLSRLGVVQDVRQTGQATRAVENLVETLADGEPAIVWADMWSLPYNNLEHDDGMWGAMPILVFGYEPEAGVVAIADRAQVALQVRPDELAVARGRIKKIKHRLITLDAPQADKLPAAVRLGIWDTVRLFTEKPPKGSKNNFGLAAYHHWAEMLRNPKARLSWEKQFPASLPYYAGLLSASNFAFYFGKGLEQDAERGRYAAFLEEAAMLLGAPALAEAAAQYRLAAEAWHGLAATLLPDDIPAFAEARRLMARRHALFMERGDAAMVEVQAADARLAELRQSMVVEFPLSPREVEEHRQRIAAQVMAIHDIEKQAVETLRAAMS